MSILLIIRALWIIGNRWLRWAIVIVASWPALIAFAALVGWPTLTAVVALLPLVAVVFGLVGFNPRRPRRRLQGQPLVIAAIGAAWPRFLKAIALVIGTELAFGAYFAAIPVANDRGLIPLALLLLLAISFLAMSGSVKKVMSALVIAFIVLTAVFVLGGRDKTKRRYENAKGTVAEWVGSVSATTAAAPAPAPASRTLELAPGEWTEVPIPPYHEFRFDSPDTILVRNKLGREFVLAPNGRITRRNDGVAVESFGRDIPGFTLFAGAKSGPTTVVFSQWPCPTQPCVR